MRQSLTAEAVEYDECISSEGLEPTPPQTCPDYGTKPSDGWAPVLELWECEVYHYFQVHSDLEC